MGSCRISKVQLDLNCAVQMVRERIPELVAIYHFGSTAAGNAHPDSDLDLGILAETRIHEILRFELAADLTALLGRDVDLIDLSRTTPVMLMQVLQGRLLFTSDQRKVARFETLAMSRYCRLNEERRDILQDILARGRVFGGR